MKLAVTAMLLIGWTFAADSSALERRVASLKAEAIRAENAGKLSVAENKWLSAISASSALPPDKFRLKADLMAELANLYQRQNQESKVDAVYLDRLRFLEAQQKLREEPVLEIGIALFAIQSRYEARRNFRDGRDYMERAKAFYENCKETFPALRSVCDRRLADVEGLHGSALFLQKSFDEAIPFLQAVIARDDSSVRPEVLYAALMAYGSILVDRKEMQAAWPLVARAGRIKAANPGVFPQ